MARTTYLENGEKKRKVRCATIWSLASPLFPDGLDREAFVPCVAAQFDCHMPRAQQAVLNAVLFKRVALATLLASCRIIIISTFDHRKKRGKRLRELDSFFPRPVACTDAAQASDMYESKNYKLKSSRIEQVTN